MKQKLFVFLAGPIQCGDRDCFESNVPN